MTGERRAPRSQSGRVPCREVHVRVIERVRERMFFPKEKKGIERPSVCPLSGI